MIAAAALALLLQGQVLVRQDGTPVGWAFQADRTTGPTCSVDSGGTIWTLAASGGA